MFDFNGVFFQNFDHGYTDSLYKHFYGELKIPLDTRRSNPDAALFDLMKDDQEQINARKSKLFR